MSMIVRVNEVKSSQVNLYLNTVKSIRNLKNEVLNRTVGDSDGRFDNLRGDHLQS